jgi:hypothetical protein
MKREVKAHLNALKQLDIIVVEWIDAENEPREGGWRDIDEKLPEKTTRTVIARTVGFFIGKNKTFLRTTANYDPSNNCVYGTDDIPLSAIKAIIPLRTMDDFIHHRIHTDNVGSIQRPPDQP